MADRTVEVITPATNSDLMTLEEAKRFLGIPQTDSSQDELLTMLISLYSEIAAEICNRERNNMKPTFGKEECLETWREIGNGRIYLSHWPVKKADIQSVTHNGSILAVGDYELEEHSGKLSNVTVSGAKSANWNAPVIVRYTGGYDLPTEAPAGLKYAIALLMREEKLRMQQAQTGGIRQLKHKEAMVSFYDPNAILLKMAGAKSPSMQQAEAMLQQYMRIEI